MTYGEKELRAYSYPFEDGLGPVILFFRESGFWLRVPPAAEGGEPDLFGLGQSLPMAYARARDAGFSPTHWYQFFESRAWPIPTGAMSASPVWQAEREAERSRAAVPARG